MTKTMPQLRRRAAQLRTMLEERDVKDITRRVARRAYNATGAGALEFPLDPGDVCDSTSVQWPSVAPASNGPGLTIGWVLFPPSGGSGGHTTIFRMVEALEAAGHRCILYLYERHSTPIDFHAGVIRQFWPQIKADVVDLADGLGECDAYFATSWETAHVLGSRGTQTPGRRFYFVQDYEPFFYPRGSESALAEDSYRFGFKHVAIGHMVGDLVKPFGPVDVLEFSCDTTIYNLTNRGERNGVVFYARPDTPRRGASLAVLALREFHQRHPEQPIHIFGDSTTSLPFPAYNHARTSPRELADLYNQSIGGLALSFTNISLIVEEMLACGAIPIVNDSPFARADMPSPAVGWAAPTPSGLASALSAAVETPDRQRLAVEASRSVRLDNWDSAKSTFVSIVESAIPFAANRL